VILAFGGSGDPLRDYYIGGTQVGMEAIESLGRQLSAELGRHGVRVVTLRTGGVPESLPPGAEGRDEIVAGMVKQSMPARGDARGRGQRGRLRRRRPRPHDDRLDRQRQLRGARRLILGPCQWPD
jgi:NAD(P)-dependent dehydrogenase (short-subunit alcohol dehydrogenase family)